MKKYTKQGKFVLQVCSLLLILVLGSPAKYEQMIEKNIKSASLDINTFVKAIEIEAKLKKISFLKKS